MRAKNRFLVRLLEVAYKKTDEWCIQWQKVRMSGTTSDNEWQQVVQHVTTNENEWQRVKQRVTANETK